MAGLARRNLRGEKSKCPRKEYFQVPMYHIVGYLDIWTQQAWWRKGDGLEKQRIGTV